MATVIEEARGLIQAAAEKLSEVQEPSLIEQVQVGTVVIGGRSHKEWKIEAIIDGRYMINNGSGYLFALEIHSIVSQPDYAAELEAAKAKIAELEADLKHDDTIIEAQKRKAIAQADAQAKLGLEVATLNRKLTIEEDHGRMLGVTLAEANSDVKFWKGAAEERLQAISRIARERNTAQAVAAKVQERLDVTRDEGAAMADLADKYMDALIWVRDYAATINREAHPTFPARTVTGTILSRIKLALS